jgi:hypothetical protein
LARLYASCVIVARSIRARVVHFLRHSVHREDNTNFVHCNRTWSHGTGDSCRAGYHLSTGYCLHQGQLFTATRPPMAASIKAIISLND